ncbi:pyruvate, water dikinase regulatory protein [Candidatus Collinsella stercoripullorum]|uniref:pyruvate, water dikinase regulatory protein n=1 Tax=Candidatus Collinsella stercoripullorum TaxID=2838522 RepID=UPI0022E29F4A|nr:pyruvate, water dikinase regulatory protein [Candidatus Collinsella stercoripullorum]
MTATVHVISDALGDTACEVVLAAAGQFREGSVRIARLPRVTGIDEVERYLAPHIASGEPIAVFHTIVDPGLRSQLAFTLRHLDVPSVDLMGPALDTLSGLLGDRPAGTPGVIHRTDERYFRRIEAMEYFVAHDDGRGADDLSDADIVLIGVSRTSKTPLSMYLAFQGYRVANVPLARGVEPPPSIFEVDPMRLFGLLSTADIVAGIRERRLGDEESRVRAASYADPEEVARELEEAHALMRRLGCFVVRTDRKAIEESAAEITARLDAVAAARRARETGRQ